MSEKMPVLSIMSPVYNAQDCIFELVERVAEEARAITPHFEIVLIDDGSQDQSWSQIRKACAAHPFVRGIRLSRNFGQHQAITAGLHACRGQYVVLMDCDLQDDPKYLPHLYEAAQQGADVVLTTKTNRAHGPMRNLVSFLFRSVFNSLRNSTQVEVRGDIGTYSLLSRKVVNAYLQMKDYHRHYLMVLRWLGFSTQYIEIKHAPRFAGKSSYSYRRLFIHAIDGITSQSDKLLYLSVKIGFGSLLCSLAAIAYLVISYYVSGYKEGWASVMVAILTSTSLILLSLGIVGIYIGKIFDQAKGRPLFLIQEEI